MKSRLILPALAAVAAAGGAFYSLQAQDDGNRLLHFKIQNSEDDSGAGRTGGDSREFRNDGSSFRFFRNGKEVKPGDNNGGELMEQMQRQMEEMMREHMGEGFGPGGNSLEELMKQMRDRNGRQGN